MVKWNRLKICVVISLVAVVLVVCAALAFIKLTSPQEQTQSQTGRQAQAREAQTQGQQDQASAVDVILTKLAWPDETVIELKWEPLRFSKSALDDLMRDMDRSFGIDMDCWKISKSKPGTARLEMKLPPDFGDVTPIQKCIEKHGVQIVSTRQAVSADRQKALLREAKQDFAQEHQKPVRIDTGIPEVELVPNRNNSMVTMRAKARATFKQG